MPKGNQIYIFSFIYTMWLFLKKLALFAQALNVFEVVVINNFLKPCSLSHEGTRTVLLNKEF